MNRAQNRTLHGLLTKTGLLKDKVNLVLGFTKGRSESSTSLSFEEAGEMIAYLKTRVPGPTGKIDLDAAAANKMRRKIISLAHEMHWHLIGTQEVDMNRLNAWCLKYSYLHKKLNDYTYKELPKLLTQFNYFYQDFITKL